MKPVLMWELSKSVLNISLRSDTSFLAKSSIMDYSLLCGVDNSTGAQQLVVGAPSPHSFLRSSFDSAEMRCAQV